MPTWAGDELRLEAQAWRDAVDLAWSPPNPAVEHFDLYVSFVPEATHGGIWLGSVGCSTAIRVRVRGSGRLFLGIVAKDTLGEVIAEENVMVYVGPALPLAPITDLKAIKWPGQIVRLYWSAGCAQICRGRIGNYGSCDIIAITDGPWWNDPVLGNSASYWYNAIQVTCP
ncbi:MAG: hypothetical protein V1895_03670 [Parcubacteria group bacterium]